jgi:hypothetical protein
MDLKEIGLEGVDWIHHPQDGGKKVLQNVDILTHHSLHSITTQKPMP